MCLTTKNKEGLVSEEPIKCYKVYMKGEEDGAIKSLVQGTEYCVEEGDVIKAVGIGYMGMKDYENGPWILGEGYIRAVRTRYGMLPILTWNYGVIRTLMNDEGELNKEERSAIEFLLDDTLHTINSVVLYEMEISAGEKYWLGEYDDDICAKRMILAKEFKITKRSELLELMMKNHKFIYSRPKRKGIRRIMKKYRELIKQYKEKGE